tara:strand:+ start:2005 stop:2514 length:510 start_codon:yes stop_codon:yes gene_type:complete
MKKEAKNYLGSIVLGMNDALVELTGALAGLTLAFQNSQIIVVSGFITGFAASLSMAASEYLSTKAEGMSRRTKVNGKHPKTAAFYTGLAYLLTVLFLLFPYLVVDNVYYALGWALINSVIVIFGFTYYVSIEKGEGFWHRFFEMVMISLGVAVISFGLGWVLRVWVVGG